MNDQARVDHRVVSFQEARKIVLDHTQTRAIETRALLEARGCFLAENLTTPFPLPRFDHSAVDGYAILSSDAANASGGRQVMLRLSDVIKTGTVPTQPLMQECAIQVFTGARIPVGCDTVIMVEDVTVLDGNVIVSAPFAAGKNIRRMGEEFGAGDVCLPKGTRMSPAAIGLAAALGRIHVAVHSKPKIALLITGSELVAPGMPLKEAQIYDSNRYSLCAALAEIGMDNIELSSCGDDPKSIQQQIVRALETCDVLITSGGASVGDVDYVKPAIRELGGTIHFEKVAMKPGKPTVFGSLNGKAFLGLPGNPVSALVALFLFVKPALLKMMGNPSDALQLLPARLATPIRKRSDRTEFVRAKISTSSDEIFVKPCRGQESHMLGGFAAADAFIVFDGESRLLSEGMLVKIMPLLWT